MVGMTFEQQELLYQVIEKAAQEHKPVIFPEGVYPILQTGRHSGGLTFTIPGLLWMDARRNIYEAWMVMEQRRRDGIEPELYVHGSKSLDGLSSGDTSMFRAENRYRSII